MDKENMRPATKEEREAIDKYIASICVDTDFSIWDLQEQVKVYDAYRNKGYSDGLWNFYEKALNFEDYIEPVNEEYGTNLYDGKDITRMIINIYTELGGRQ